LTQTLPDALQVMADVGYSLSSAPAALTTYTIDTGSLGALVPSSKLPHDSNVIGPAGPGVKVYNSSGNTYSGNYYLARVSVQIQGGTVVQTIPIVVLGIDKAYCTGPSTKPCYQNPPSPTLHYLGVGFNRNSTAPGDLFNSPTANAFLHLTNNVKNGTDVSPGYILTPNDSATVTGLTLGVPAASGYAVVNLTPNPSVPGDFKPQAGCYSFPGLPKPNQFCGTALLDVGIDEMFLDLPFAQRPAGSFDSNNEVPAKVNMTIQMGAQNTPAMEYSFISVQSNPPNGSPAPTSVHWSRPKPKAAQIFVNTGRRPLYDYDYFYEGQCGQVGFSKLP